MEVFHHSCYAMGTRLNAVFPHLAPADGFIIADKIDEILKTEEARLSCFLPDSEISQINREAVVQPILVSEEMTMILNECRRFNEMTAGAFDAALYFHTQSLGQKHDLQNIVSNGWRDLVWAPEKKQLFIKNPRTGLDLGGFGKGWALEKILQYLKEAQIESALISFGESSVSVIGSHPLGNHWPLTVSHPDSGVSVLFELVGQSVSVSGLKWKEKEQTVKPHIVRTSDFSKIDENTVVIVRSESPLISEVLSTSIASANEDQKKRVLKNFPEADIYFCGSGMAIFEKVNL